MSPTDAIIPFRWRLDRREQLGALLEGEMAAVPDGYLEELRRLCVRVLALGGDSDLIFVGRSPEHLFDYLSGTLMDVPDRGLTLLQFSKGYRGNHIDRYGRVRDFTDAEKQAFQSYLASEGLDPIAIANNSRPVRFVDLVWTGRTFATLLALIRDLAQDQGADWKAVTRQIGFVGITERRKNSPNTFRWQQDARWTDQASGVFAKNVSASVLFWQHAGNHADKVTPSHTRKRWTAKDAHAPDRDEEHLKALRRSVDIFDRARTKEERAAFLALLAQQPEFSQRWLRKLSSDLKG